jgi:hypothetical protein
MCVLVRWNRVIYQFYLDSSGDKFRVIATIVTTVILQELQVTHSFYSSQIILYVWEVILFCVLGRGIFLSRSVLSVYGDRRRVGRDETSTVDYA